MSSYIYLKGTDNLPSTPFTNANLSATTGYLNFEGCRLSEYPTFENEVEQERNANGTIPHKVSFRDIIEVTTDWEFYPSSSRSMRDFIIDGFGVSLREVLEKKYLFFQRKDGELYPESDTTLNSRVSLTSNFNIERDGGFYRANFQLKYYEKL